MQPDLPAYFAHLGYQGKGEPTLATLGELHRLHPQAIAFENLAPLLAEPVRLDLPSLQRKLLAGGRGGWCFEHNLLLQSVLEALGYSVTGLAARVLWGQSPQSTPPRSHMLLRVDIAGEAYIADVGFGGLTLTAPLRLVADLVQQTPHGRFVLRSGARGYSLWALLPQGPSVLYGFDLQPQLPADYEYANWYLSTHPDSHFRKALIAARTGPQGRHALHNARYTLHGVDGSACSQTVTSVSLLRTLLQDVFAVTVPPGAHVDARLERVLQN